MAPTPESIQLFHLTHVERLGSILRDGMLLCDATLQERAGDVDDAGIGYSHIKRRRLEEITVDCCGKKTVGQFVPFYFCPRSPMLYTINRGNTGYPPGCESQIVHLVTSLKAAVGLGQDWAFSDGNAGAFHTTFYNDLRSLDEVDWGAVGDLDWRGTRMHRKMAEFLVERFFPWTAIEEVGCKTRETAKVVEGLIGRHCPREPLPKVSVRKAGLTRDAWYYG